MTAQPVAGEARGGTGKQGSRPSSPQGRLIPLGPAPLRGAQDKDAPRSGARDKDAPMRGAQDKGDAIGW